MSEYPLISAIMPTGGKRKRFVEQAVSLFERQDYPNKELIVIDEASQDENFAFSACFSHSGVRIINVWDDVPLTIGAKRNLACSLARGEIIALWDDDDWYSPSRLAHQAAPILQGQADVTALKMGLLLDARAGTLWSCTEEVHRALFNLDVKCGTMMFKALYFNDVCYPNINRGEDYHFLCKMLQCGARLERITDPASYICVRHGDNVTSDIDGLSSPGWEQVPLEQYLPEQDRAFYRAIAGGANHGSG